MPDNAQRIGVIRAGSFNGADASENDATTTLDVDQASARDAQSVIDVFAEAFLNDPTWSWAFPDPTARRQWWKFCINEALRYPWTFKTDGFETVSVWIPPSADRVFPRRRTERSWPTE